MSNASIIAALSVLATGSLALLGCDKDRPATEVPAATARKDVPALDPVHEGEDEDRASATVEPDATDPPKDPAATAAEEPPDSHEPDQDAVAEAAAPKPQAEETSASPPPKARAKPRTKRKRNRSRASKGEAACGEGTCA